MNAVQVGSSKQKLAQSSQLVAVAREVTFSAAKPQRTSISTASSRTVIALQSVGATSDVHVELPEVVGVAIKIAGKVEMLPKGGLIVLLAALSVVNTADTDRLLAIVAARLMETLVVRLDTTNSDELPTDDPEVTVLLVAELKLTKTDELLPAIVPEVILLFKAPVFVGTSIEESQLDQYEVVTLVEVCTTFSDKLLVVELTVIFMVPLELDDGGAGIVDDAVLVPFD